ncbi:MAG TPA: 16S rRNA (adenine(1518)-N(6)/adenine(1519)-N(6))-dimethyltransferase RsmA [Candidatus Saccharimonadales bacterium]|nr:16S rRNA (adenine(1518)-N(6)/adenine(1519)-N(6))-dimethyltransferase RsmA [Candidatus Saccharimonadales bacterium]
MAAHDSVIPKKSLGQHWLHDTSVLEAMCQAANVQSGEYVLEIGPGLGTLTDILLSCGAEVLALEYDPGLITKLHTKYDDRPSSEIFIQEGDIRTYDFSYLPEHYKIVANIPYYLTAYLLRLLTETPYKPDVTALLVQKEVAERVAARPGALSFIAVAVQFYYEVSLGEVVPAELFTPPPKVDSQILILKSRATPLFQEVDTKQFFQLVKAGFSQRRKTLLNSLSAGLHISRDQTIKILQSADIAPTQRAQTLSLVQWHQLYAAAYL